MPLSLGLYTSVAMLLIYSPFCSMCSTAVAGRIKRQRPQHRQHRQHLQAFYGGAFLPSGTSTSAFAGPTPTPTPTLRRQLQQLRTRRNTQLSAAVHAAVEQPRLHARGFMTRQNSFSSGSLSSAPRPPPSPTATTPMAPPRNVAVLARGDSGDDLERCRRLAQKLGVELVVPRREGNAEQGEEKEEETRGKGAVGAVGGAARGENRDFKFTLLFDERGRLALDQPGSGFNPLVVRRPNEVPRNTCTYEQVTSQPSSSMTIGFFRDTDRFQFLNILPCACSQLRLKTFEHAYFVAGGLLGG